MKKVLIVGAGIGGLFAGAILAKKGIKVQLLERNGQVGGYLQSKMVHGCCFDIGGQDITFLGANDRQVLQELGIWDRLRPMPRHSSILFLNDGVSVEIASFDETRADLCRQFPSETKAIDDFFNKLKTVMAALNGFFSIKGFYTKSSAMMTLWPYFSKTAEDLLVASFQDPVLRATLGSFCVFYQGEIPAKLSALNFMGLLGSYLQNGGHCYQNGSGQLSADLATIITEGQGEIITHTTVKELVIKNGRCVGAQTDDGTVYQADCVIGNLDPTQWEGAPKGLQPWIKKITHQERGLSRVEVFLVVKGDQSLGTPVYFLKGGLDEAKEDDGFRQGSPTSLRCLIPTMVVPEGIAPAGVHCFNVAFPSSYEQWQAVASHPGGVSQHQEKYLTTAIDLLNRVWGGVADRVMAHHVVTPIDLYDIGHHRGAVLYGASATPAQSGYHRFPIKTPVPNLFWTGQWTLGGSVCLVLRSAMMASDAVLDRLHP